MSSLALKVEGDYALFTRPETKVERVSYLVMTPSAARGILEAIYWHPQFQWVIREIHVLRQPRTITIMRNEVSSKIPLRGSARTYFADEDRTQRNSVCLRDVAYAIYADVRLKPGVVDHPSKFREQFERRVERGKCFHRPALGCREFAAEFGPLSTNESPINWTEDLGLMLWDIDYRPKPPHRPLFFKASVERGVLKVPARPLGESS